MDPASLQELLHVESNYRKELSSDCDSDTTQYVDDMSRTATYIRTHPQITLLRPLQTVLALFRRMEQMGRYTLPVPEQKVVRRRVAPPSTRPRDEIDSRLASTSPRIHPTTPPESVAAPSSASNPAPRPRPHPNPNRPLRSGTSRPNPTYPKTPGRSLFGSVRGWVDTVGSAAAALGKIFWPDHIQERMTPLVLHVLEPMPTLYDEKNIDTVYSYLEATSSEPSIQSSFAATSEPMQEYNLEWLQASLGSFHVETLDTKTEITFVPDRRWSSKSNWQTNYRAPYQRIHFDSLQQGVTTLQEMVQAWKSNRYIHVLLPELLRWASGIDFSSLLAAESSQGDAHPEGGVMSGFRTLWIWFHFINHSIEWYHSMSFLAMQDWATPFMAVPAWPRWKAAIVADIERTMELQAPQEVDSQLPPLQDWLDRMNQVDKHQFSRISCFHLGVALFFMRQYFWIAIEQPLKEGKEEIQVSGNSQETLLRVLDMEEKKQNKLTLGSCVLLNVKQSMWQYSVHYLQPTLPTFPEWKADSLYPCLFPPNTQDQEAWLLNQVFNHVITSHTMQDPVRIQAWCRFVQELSIMDVRSPLPSGLGVGTILSGSFLSGRAAVPLQSHMPLPRLSHFSGEVPAVPRAYQMARGMFCAEGYLVESKDKVFLYCMYFLFHMYNGLEAGRALTLSARQSSETYALLSRNVDIWKEVIGPKIMQEIKAQKINLTDEKVAAPYLESLFRFRDFADTTLFPWTTIMGSDPLEPVDPLSISRALFFAPWKKLITVSPEESESNHLPHTLWWPLMQASRQIYMGEHVQHPIVNQNEAVRAVRIYLQTLHQSAPNAYAQAMQSSIQQLCLQSSIHTVTNLGVVSRCLATAFLTSPRDLPETKQASASSLSSVSPAYAASWVHTAIDSRTTFLAISELCDTLILLINQWPRPHPPIYHRLLRFMARFLRVSNHYNSISPRRPPESKHVPLDRPSTVSPPFEAYAQFSLKPSHWLTRYAEEALDRVTRLHIPRNDLTEPHLVGLTWACYLDDADLKRVGYPSGTLLSTLGDLGAPFQNLAADQPNLPHDLETVSQMTHAAHELAQRLVLPYLHTLQQVVKRILYPTVPVVRVKEGPGQVISWAIHQNLVDCCFHFEQKRSPGPMILPAARIVSRVSEAFSVLSVLLQQIHTDLPEYMMGDVLHSLGKQKLIRDIEGPFWHIVPLDLFLQRDALLSVIPNPIPRTRSNLETASSTTV